MADFYIEFFFLLLVVSGIILDGMKRSHSHMRENNCCIVICFLFWLAGLQLKETRVILDHKNTL